MEPYYEDSHVTIYHGDCRGMMPVDADVLVTDPPYGTGHYESADEVVLTPSLLASWAECYDALMVFGWPERLVRLCADAGLAPSEWVTWSPTNGRCRGFNPGGLWRVSEHIAVFGEVDWTRVRRPRGQVTKEYGDKRVKGRGEHFPEGDVRAGDVWTDPAPGLGFNYADRRHPNEKPVSLLEKLVVGTDGVVLDPFMGSGTTVVAAKRSGRTAVGIEVEEKYCEVAAERLSQGVLDLGGVA